MSPARPLDVCLYGLGAIGSAVARAVAADPGFRITGAIDVDPAKAGRDLSAILKVRGLDGIRVGADASGVLRQSRPDVVVHSTGSRLRQIAAQLEEIIGNGIPCVTSCEEMAFPEAADAACARRLDRLARDQGVALFGAGVNPGFVMDLLVVALSGATRDVRHIGVERVLDPKTRRGVFQEKVGLGMSRREATRRVAEGSMGHVGLRESALLVARGMGWDITDIDEKIRVLSGDDKPRARRRRSPGDPVRGLEQVLVAREGKTERIRMEMVMSAGVSGPHDAITIKGKPDLNLWIQGGIPGDQATVACLVNGMRKIVSPPRTGLLTVLDLPPGPGVPPVPVVTGAAEPDRRTHRTARKA